MPLAWQLGDDALVRSAGRDRAELYRPMKKLERSEEGRKPTGMKCELAEMWMVDVGIEWRTVL